GDGGPARVPAYVLPLTGPGATREPGRALLRATVGAGTGPALRAAPAAPAPASVRSSRAARAPPAALARHPARPAGPRGRAPARADGHRLDQRAGAGRYVHDRSRRRPAPQPRRRSGRRAAA